MFLTTKFTKESNTKAHKEIASVEKNSSRSRSVFEKNFMFFAVKNYE
jgi:hypothetical protein